MAILMVLLWYAALMLLFYCHGWLTLAAILNYVNTMVSPAPGEQWKHVGVITEIPHSHRFRHRHSPALWLHSLWEWVALQIGVLRNAYHWPLDNVLTRPTVCYTFIHSANESLIYLFMFEEHHWNQNCHSTPFATHKLFGIGYIIHSRQYHLLNIMYLSSASHWFNWTDRYKAHLHRQITWIHSP